MMGTYNKLTKDILYMFRSTRFTRVSGWTSITSYSQPTMQIDMPGRAGSYRNNVTVTVSQNAGYINTNDISYVTVVSSWSLF